MWRSRSTIRIGCVQWPGQERHAAAAAVVDAERLELGQDVVDRRVERDLPVLDQLMKAIDVIGLVIEAMRKSERSSIAGAALAGAPWCEKWTISPSRATSNCAWGSLPVSR